MLLVTACVGDAPVVEDQADTLSADVADEIGRACAEVAAGLNASQPGRFVAAMESLASLSSSIEGTNQADAIMSAMEVGTPAFADQAFDLAGVESMAPDLVNLSSVLVAAGAPGCADIASTFAGVQRPQASSLESDLAASRSLWEANAPDAYALQTAYLLDGPASVGVECTFATPLVQVIEGVIEVAVDLSAVCDLDSDAATRVPLTVEDLFDLIADTLEVGVLNVEYDLDYGYPTQILVETDELSIEVSTISFVEDDATDA